MIFTDIKNKKKLREKVLTACHPFPFLEPSYSLPTMKGKRDMREGYSTNTTWLMMDWLKGLNEYLGSHRHCRSLSLTSAGRESRWSKQSDVMISTGGVFENIETRMDIGK